MKTLLHSALGLFLVYLVVINGMEIKSNFLTKYEISEGAWNALSRSTLDLTSLDEVSLKACCYVCASKFPECHMVSFSGGVCEAAEIPDGFLLGPVDTPQKRQVMLNTRLFTETKQGAYVYSIGSETPTIDTVTPGEHFDIPPAPVNSSRFLLTSPYKGGVMVVDRSDANWWLPGDRSWSTLWKNAMNHDQGASVTVYDETGVLLVNFWSGGTIRRSSFLHNGAWAVGPDKTPDKTLRFVMLAKGDGSDAVFSFGGEISGRNGNPSPTARVYKLDLSTRLWTRMAAEMPSGGGAFPSCGTATYKGRQSAICLGARDRMTSNSVDVFDMTDETWTTLEGVAVPSPVTYGSLVFSVDTKLYRVRGMDENGNYVNSMEVLDMESDTWEESIALEPNTVMFNQLFFAKRDWAIIRRGN